MIGLFAASVIVIVLTSYQMGGFGGKYHAYIVKSPSMEPTLRPEDTILVDTSVTTEDIYTHYGNGDIIIFHTYMLGGPNLRPGYPDELIVHRAINKTLTNGILYFSTKGDNNQTPDFWHVPENYVVGKVIDINPQLGPMPLTMTSLILAICAAIGTGFASVFLFAFRRKEKTRAEPAVELTRITTEISSCSKCGKQLPKGDLKFCPFCGASLEQK
jgi:signal peptidase I